MLQGKWLKRMNIKSYLIERLDSYRRVRLVLSIFPRLLKYLRIAIFSKSRERFESSLNLRKVEEGSVFFGYYDIPPDFEGQLLYNKINDAGLNCIFVCDEGESGAALPIGKTICWSYQQGSMAQWIPWRGRKAIAYNTLENNNLGARVVFDRKESVFIPYPVELATPHGFLSVNFWRFRNNEYGYKKLLSPPNNSVLSDAEDGIWHYDTNSHSAELLVSYLEVFRFQKDIIPKGSDYFFNHLSLSRDGRYLIFIFRTVSSKGRRSQLFLYDFSNSKLKLILDEGFVSHYCWIGNDEFVVYAKKSSRKGYFIFDVGTGDFTIFANGVLDRYGDGHPTCSPCRKYLIVDTYPDRDARQKLILLQIENFKVRELGSFYNPFSFFADKRCDLHPRWLSDGKVCIDSAHSGERSCYITDLSSMLDALEAVDA